MYNTIGTVKGIIAQERRKRGITYAQIAEALGLKTPSAAHKMLTGMGDIAYMDLMRIIQFLGLDPAETLGIK